MSEQEGLINNTLEQDEKFMREALRLAEIAKDLGLRENTASVRLGRIRMQLREYLIKEGYCDE